MLRNQKKLGNPKKRLNDEKRGTLSITRLGFTALLALMLAAGGCAGCGDDPIDPPGPTGVGGGGGGGVDPGPATSPIANVKFKSGKRLQAELARVLDAQPGELCQELGQYECFGLHTVVLGEAEAFGIGLYEALPQTSAATPLAVERVVMSACTQRAAADFADPAGAVIFKDLAVDSDGKLTDPQGAAVTNAITDLYRRALSRDPKAHEIEQITAFYNEVDAQNVSTHVARDWAALSCFAVLTSMEALFY